MPDHPFPLLLDSEEGILMRVADRLRAAQAASPADWRLGVITQIESAARAIVLAKSPTVEV